MQSERMFFIWTLPHTSGPVDPLSPPPTRPPPNLQCHHVYLFSAFEKEEEKSESHSSSTDTRYCNTALPELQFFPRVTVFFFLSNCSIRCCGTAVTKHVLLCVIIARGARNAS